MVSVNDIAEWRTRIFLSMLPVVLAIGTVATVAIVPVMIHLNMWPVAVVDTVALAWTFAIWRFQGISYNTRVMHFLGVVYVLSIVLMLQVGSASLSYLLGPPVIAGLLLSMRPAMLALGLGSLIIVVFGATGHLSLGMPGWENDPLKASLVAASNYASVGAMLTLTCSKLLQGLASSLTELRTFSATLESKQAALNELNDELQLTAAAVARLNDMVLIARAVDGPDATQPVIFANDALLRRTGFARTEIIGQSFLALQGPDTEAAVVARLLDAMAANRPFDAEVLIYTRAGEPFWVEFDMVPFSSAGERPSHWVMIGRDITERRNAADAIHRLAFYDVLTGLANRRLLMERLEAMVGQARAGGGLGAVLYLDLDNFKNVNDARGHATGDGMLQHVATRLAGALSGRDTVARIGGDEFVVLLDALDTDPALATSMAMSSAEAIRNVLAQPMGIDGQTYQTSASIGVALPLSTTGSAHDLLREADTAMYHAKSGGRNGVAVFETAMLAGAERRLTLERDLAHALENGELAMHLQLQVDHRGVPDGAELLMRWRRADGSNVPPDVFIPVAESSGLILALGRWVLREACRIWFELDAAGMPLRLSINVSPRQFRQPDFVDQVRAILRETGAPPDQFIFEVTEGLLIDDIDQTIARMQALTELGIRFSIDDFGTGYSNLAYLKKMPLYELKIDKSFMRDTPHDVNGTAIVQSILAMAKHLGLRVVAEGIETDGQAGFLATHGSPHMQGYLFHRPMPLAGLLERLGAPATTAA
jgi:diguanylate cyclase (GGDEF)-like protein/PAS domain S-box-containing protein